MLNKFKNNLKKLDLFDLKLLQLAAVCVALILAKIFPVLLEVRIPIYLVLAILFAIRPMGKMLRR